MTDPAAPQDSEREQPLGLWIRVSATLADDAEVRSLARELFAPPERHGAKPTIEIPPTASVPTWIAVAATEGLMVNLWSQVAEHRGDGDIGQVDDDQLEEWARWRGEAGRFAALYRAKFVTAGRINRWLDYNGKLAEWRERERERWQRRRDEQNERRRIAYEEEQKRQGKVVAPRRTAGAKRSESDDKGVSLRIAPAPDGNGNGKKDLPLLLGDGNPSSPHIHIAGGENSDSAEVTVPDLPQTPSEWALGLTVALNSGQLDNPAIGDRLSNPALPYSASAIDAAERIATAGVPYDYARVICYQVGRAFTVDRPGDAITSISYAAPRVLKSWERDQARMLAAASERPAGATNGDGAPSGASTATGGGNGRQGPTGGRRDLKGEGIIWFGKLVAGVRSEQQWDYPDREPGLRGSNRFVKIIRPDLLTELPEPARTALAAIGGERAITYPKDGETPDEHRWAFAAAYAAAAGT